MFFSFIHSCCRFVLFGALRVFFNSISVVGTPSIEKGPLIVVANHPNFFFDPLLLSFAYDRDLRFLAKATLFKNFVGRIVLSWLGVLPVYRKQDGASGDSNAETFSAVAEALIKGDAIALFPEGVSMGERKVFPVKTGAARMAALALEKGAAKNLRIQPVGLVYTDPDQFYSDVTIVFGASISAHQYFSGSDSSEQVQAVRRLTQDIEADLRHLSVHLENGDAARLAEKVAKVYDSAGILTDDYERLSRIAERLHNRALDSFGHDVDEVERRVDSFLARLNWVGFSGYAINHRVSLWHFLFWAVPVLIGVLVNWVPYRATKPLAESLCGHKVYLATLKLVVGGSLFLAWYMAIAGVLWWFNVDYWLIAIMLVGGVSFGMITLAKLRLVLLAICHLVPGLQSRLRALLLEQQGLLDLFAKIRDLP